MNLNRREAGIYYRTAVLFNILLTFKGVLLDLHMRLPKFFKRKFSFGSRKFALFFCILIFSIHKVFICKADYSEAASSFYFKYFANFKSSQQKKNSRIQILKKFAFTDEAEKRKKQHRFRLFAKSLTFLSKLYRANFNMFKGALRTTSGMQ